MVDGLERVAGRMNDIDAHEQIPTPLLGELWGEASGRMAEKIPGFLGIVQKDESTAVGARDDMEITEDIVWNYKGAGAPSAIDFTRRADVMDVMGVQRQLIFPTTGFLAYLMYDGLDFNGFLANTRFPRNFELRDSIARPAILEYNNWVIRNTKEIGNDRVRFVGMMLVESVEQMVHDAEHMIENGVKALVVPSGEPPAGTSPAHPDLDPFWRLCAEANVPVTLHIGNELMFLDTAWNASPTLLPNLEVASPEAPLLTPQYLTNCSLAAQNYLVTMVMGGVFERHPDLRFGIIEVFSSWVPSTMERLDACTKALTKSERGHLSMKPSEFVRRNVRVNPMVFEPVTTLLERHPDMADVFCFGSDYPHMEGGRDSLRRFYDMVAPLGDEMVEKFFVSNGEWLLPA
jgi:predicted TIM-barrel fold metal-dependent hydrolase